jgi:hypothetical protein
VGHGQADAHETLAKDPHYTKYGPVLPGKDCLRNWIERMPKGRTATAAFDTRFDKPRWLTGSAAKKIARRFTKKGHPVLASHSFFVKATGGPLAEGERDRAVAWGRELATQLQAIAAA